MPSDLATTLNESPELKMLVTSANEPIIVENPLYKIPRSSSKISPTSIE